MTNSKIRAPFAWFGGKGSPRIKKALLAALPALLWRLAVDALHFRIPEIRGTLRGWKAGWAADASDNLP